MILTFENMVEMLAQYVARTGNRSLAEARPLVQRMLADARQEYRAAGMPHGNSAVGLLIWLGRSQLALAA
jgi:hypothetical protein